MCRGQGIEIHAVSQFHARVIVCSMYQIQIMTGEIEVAVLLIYKMTTVLEPTVCLIIRLSSPEW